MANFYKDNDDLQFYVEKAIDWAPLVNLIEYGFKAKDAPADLQEAVETYRDVLQMVGEFVAEEIAPRAKAIDEAHVSVADGITKTAPEFDEIFAHIKELGLHGLTLPRELGGMNCPVVLYFLTAELIARGDVSVMTHHGFHSGIAMSLLLYSAIEGSTHLDPESLQITKTRFAEAMTEIAAGEAWGAMDITEANAGSDMAALSTRGEQDDDGNWFVSGEKIFITSGHGKYHLVVARTEESREGDDSLAGLKGLSLFLVPIYEIDGDGKRKQLATVERVEDKIGHHGSPTCTISFDRTPAQLIGGRGEGFKYMLMLMNNARLGVGFESIGLCEAAYRMAKQYAAERKSMGKTIDRHEMIADYLDEMATEIQGLRALAVEGAYCEESAHRLRLQRQFLPDADVVTKKRLATEQRRQQARARRITPLLKLRAAEKAVHFARMGMQIHGGVGYTKEYGAEKLLRDALVLPIYEGTTQIQALMVMKDRLGAIIKNPQAFVKKMAQARWRSVSSRDALERRVAKVQGISLAAQQHLVSKTAASKLKALAHQPLSEWPNAFFKSWDPKRDFAFAMLHAERLAEIVTDATICEVLLEQAQNFPERRELLERYLERAEPRCKFHHDTLTTTGERLLRELNPEDAADSAADEQPKSA